MLVPSTFCVSKRHQVLWGAMCFLSEWDPAGPLAAHPRGEVVKAVDRRFQLLEHRAADTLKDFFRQEHALVRKALSPRPIARLQEQFSEVYEEIFRDAVHSMGPWALAHLDRVAKVTKAKKKLDPFTQPAVDWLRRHAAKKVKGISQTTRKQIRDTLAEGTEDGETVQALADRIDALYLDEIIPNRSMAIARTETTAAANFASFTAAETTGVRMTKEWFTMGDARVRDAHADAEGQTVPIDEPFVVDEEELMYPGDPAGSAENVIECRCSMLYHVG